MARTYFLFFSFFFFLLLHVADAGLESRGFEVLSLYDAYRAEVDVMSAEGHEEGSWTLLKICVPLPNDFPGGKLDTSRKGCNFIGFLRHATDGGPNPQTARDTINDRWAPTVEEVRNYHKWPPLTHGDHNSARIDLKSYFGDRKSQLPPFDEVYRRVGARLAEVHTIRPEVAKVHIDRFQESVRYAIHARVREAAGFQITELGQCLFDNFGLSKKTSAKTKTMAAKLGWTTGYNAIDNKATKDALRLTGQAKEDAIKYINGFAESFAAGTTSSKNGGQNRDHMNVISTQKSVRAALRKKLSGTPTNACGFP